MSQTLIRSRHGPVSQYAKSPLIPEILRARGRSKHRRHLRKNWGSQPAKARLTFHGDRNYSPILFPWSVYWGTDSTHSFSRGNTLPIASRPFGMVHWTLQSGADTPWMFQPGERRIQGFRSTHQLSPWLSDYGHAAFLPFCGEINPDSSKRASSYRPEDATFAPHSLRLHLAPYGVDSELIPTERCALIRASFAKPDVPGFFFDIPGEHPPDIHQDAARCTISFTSTANSGGVPDNFATYYVLQFSEHWKTFGMTELKNHSVGLVYSSADTKSLDVRVATSFISFEQAQRNLDHELGTTSAGALRQQGKDVWNKHLLRIEIEGGTLNQQRTFYSCLYPWQRGLPKTSNAFSHHPSAELQLDQAVPNDHATEN
jgi:putative alpha-1,2-mannosidase